MRSLWLAVALCACGDVNVIPDAAVPDAYAPDSPVALMCAAGEMVCNDTCADLMTSEQYCGSCTTSCVPTEGCLAGSCVPNYTDCARVKAIDPMAPDGLYTNPNNGTPIFCEFSAGLGYEDLVVNPYPAAPSGYTVVRAAEFQKPGFQQFFIAHYNRFAGVRTFSTFTTSNCCMGPVSGLRYNFGSATLFTGTGTTIFCNQQITAGTYLTFGRSGTYLTSLPFDYFTQFPPTEAAGCSDGNNAAWWVKIRNL